MFPSEQCAVSTLQQVFKVLSFGLETRSLPYWWYVIWSQPRTLLFQECQVATGVMEITPIW